MVVENDTDANLQKNYLGHTRRTEERRLSLLGEKPRISCLVLKMKEKVRKLTDHIPSIFSRQVLSPCIYLVSPIKELAWSEKRGRAKKESLAQCFHFYGEWEGRKNSVEYIRGRLEK